MDVFISGLSEGGWSAGGFSGEGEEGQNLTPESTGALAEPGWYVHEGRVFVQGAYQLAPLSGSDLGERALGELERGERGGSEDEFLSGTILTLPARYAPRGTALNIDLRCDPYYTTPSYQDDVVTSTLFKVTPDPNSDWEWVLTRVRVPGGKYGEYRLIFSTWWDSPSSFLPGSGPDDPFNAIVDYEDLSEGPEGKSPPPGIANKGSRVWLKGNLVCSGGPELEEPREGHELHIDSPAGPHSLMRLTDEPKPGYPVNPSKDDPDLIGYTWGESDQGPAIIKVDRRNEGGSALETGVFPTDRYTFYDVRPVPPSSRPQLGAYTNPAFSTGDRYEKTVVGLSGPIGGQGMQLFIGDLLGLSAKEKTSIFLCVPSGESGPGRGYYRLDFESLLSGTKTYEPERIESVFDTHHRLYTKKPVDPLWESEDDVYESRYYGPKVTFHTVNWISATDYFGDPFLAGGNGEIETPGYFVETDVTGNGKYFEEGRGWGWFSIPDGPKSLLITVVDGEDAAKQLEGRIGGRLGRPPRPLGAPLIVVEWGEVGKLPSESKEKGADSFYDPTRELPQKTRPPVPKSNAREKFEEPLSNFYPEPVNLGMFTFLYFPWRYFGFLGVFLFELNEEEKIKIEEELTQEILEEGAKWMYDRANTLPSGVIKPYGDAGIEVTPEIGKQVPIWVAEYPMPPWNVMRPGEGLNIDDAGYAGFGNVGTITIGDGTYGVVPKN